MNKISKSKGKQEAGVALLEFAIIIPLLTIIITLLIDIGLLFGQFLVLTQVAHEGARLASTMQGARGANITLTTTCQYDENTGVCLDAVNSTNERSLIPVNNRILQLANIERFRFEGPLAVQSQIDGTAADQVTVTIQARYDGIFLDGLPLSISLMAPYLA